MQDYGENTVKPPRREHVPWGDSSLSDTQHEDANARLVHLTDEWTLKGIRFGGPTFIPLPVLLEPAYAHITLEPINEKLRLVASKLPSDQIMQQLIHESDPHLSLARGVRESLAGRSDTYSFACAFEALLFHKHQLIHFGPAPFIDFVTRKMNQRQKDKYEQRLYIKGGIGRDEQDISLVTHTQMLARDQTSDCKMVLHPKEEVLLGILGSNLALNGEGPVSIVCTDPVTASRLKELISRSSLPNRDEIQVIDTQKGEEQIPTLPSAPLILYSINQEVYGGAHYNFHHTKEALQTPKIIHLQLALPDNPPLEEDAVIGILRKRFFWVTPTPPKTGNLFPEDKGSPTEYWEMH